MKSSIYARPFGGYFVALNRNYLASTLDYTVMQMTKTNREKGYCSAIINSLAHFTKRNCQAELSSVCDAKSSCKELVTGYIEPYRGRWGKLSQGYHGNYTIECVCSVTQ